MQLRLDAIEAPEYQHIPRPPHDSTPRTAAVDASARFTLTDQASVGPRGALILPQLFRRATA